MLCLVHQLSLDMDLQFCLTCDVIFCGSSAIASRAEYAPG
ncbi:hypothetical protein Tco_0460157, partial [Tanacetum coccineum]